MNDCILSKYMLSRWLFLLAIIMLRYTTMAQESVEEPKSFKDDYSIIREIDKKESLIYNCYQGTSMFTLTTEGSTTVEMVSQGYQFSHIHDFEVLNGEDVYDTPVDKNMTSMIIWEWSKFGVPVDVICY